MNGGGQVPGSNGHDGAMRCVAIAVCSLALACLWLCSPAFGADAQDKGYLESTVRFLQEAQNPDGGFAATLGGPSDPDIGAWAAIGLAAAGINPQEQARPGGRSVYAYLAEHASELSLTTDFERALLVADAAGTSPHDFGGVDLVQRILERKLPEGGPEGGAFTHKAGETTVQDVSDTVFAILALSPIHEPAVQGAVQRATEWLIEQQSTAEGPGDGSWNATCLPSAPDCIGPEGEGQHGEVDMTAAAVEALNAAGDQDSEAQTKALVFLRKAQGGDEGDGGFPEFFPREPGEAPANAGSTSWAVQALWSAGENPESWEVPETGAKGANPLEYLAMLQQPDGAISYLAGESSGSVWMTAYTAVAYAGRWLPVPPPAAPSHPSATASEPPSGASAPAQPAPGAEPSAAKTEAPKNHRAGVLEGGGGRGARLFSRPRRGGQGAGRGSLDEPQAVSSPAESAPASHGQAAGARQAPTRRPTSRPTPAQQPGGSEQPDGSQRGSRVTGLLLDEPLASRTAPGLRSAAAADGGSWTTTAILIGLALLVIAGARLERRRPRGAHRAQVNV